MKYGFKSKLNVYGKIEDIKMNKYFEFENIIYRGETKNVDSVLSKNQILILFSRWEGFPNVVIEAFAKGLPVLTSSNIRGINELINNSNAGFFIDNKNCDFIIKEIIDNYSVYSKNAIAFSKNYTYEKIKPKWLNLVNE